MKANYIKRDAKGKKQAKATIRYIEHRRGAEGARVTRALFGSDGIMDRQEAYRMIDEAEKGSIFFRFVLSPDPKGEDTQKDLHLRDVTEQTMYVLEERLYKQVSWVAVEHADHAPHRHVHIVAVVPGKLHSEDLQALRNAATQACVEQRRELDLVREQEARGREEAEWTLAI